MVALSRAEIHYQLGHFGRQVTEELSSPALSGERDLGQGEVHGRVGSRWLRASSRPYPLLFVCSAARQLVTTVSRQTWFPFTLHGDRW